jgi:hypothetical protein
MHGAEEGNLVGRNVMGPTTSGGQKLGIPLGSGYLFRWFFSPLGLFLSYFSMDSAE